MKPSITRIFKALLSSKCRIFKNYIEPDRKDDDKDVEKVVEQLHAHGIQLVFAKIIKDGESPNAGALASMAVETPQAHGHCEEGADVAKHDVGVFIGNDGEASYNEMAASVLGRYWPS